MPSWNIHTAHVERLLVEEPPESLGICDTNAFLFGNLVPDIYVGYVVSPITRKIDYKDTHFADPGFIPAPDASRFYNELVRGCAHSDLALGAWTHLICDHYYNMRTTEYIARIGVEPGTQTRIRKQADFDVFGRTFDISSVPTPNDALLREAAGFAQYAIDEPDVYATIEAQRGIVEKNRREHVCGVPAYSLLTAEFFESTFAEVDALLRKALRMHAEGGDPSMIGRPPMGPQQRRSI